ncbi:MAG: 6-phosphogluconolactonase [Ginsengibacter sp.]
MHLHIYNDTIALIDELAKWITDYVRRTLDKQDRFTIALSGGETPKNLYKALSVEPYCNLIDWTRMHIFWGDERFVPFSDENNNAKMAYENLLNKVDVPVANIYIIKTGLSPEIAAKEYEKILHQYFDETENSFDLVLLGVGKDGHTLSLFPGSSILNEQNNWVNAVFAEDQKMYRITLMPSVVNRASSVIFLVTGIEKSKTLRNVLAGPPAPVNYPAQLIQPANKELHWFLDDEAASELRQKN